MNNEGLEALAAMASSKIPADTNTSNNQGESVSNIIASSKSRASPPSATQTGAEFIRMGASSANISPANGLQNISTLLQHPNPQIQQALLAAVGLGVGVTPHHTPSNSTYAAPVPPSNAAASTPPNLALLAGIQQLNQGDPSALVALQQQLNSYQYLANANQHAAAAAAAVAARPNQIPGPTTSMDPMQALTMALSGRSAGAVGGLPSILGENNTPAVTAVFVNSCIYF